MGHRGDASKVQAQAAEESLKEYGMMEQTIHANEELDEIRTKLTQEGEDLQQAKALVAKKKKAEKVLEENSVHKAMKDGRKPAVTGGERVAQNAVNKADLEHSAAQQDVMDAQVDVQQKAADIVTAHQNLEKTK